MKEPASSRPSEALVADVRLEFGQGRNGPCVDRHDHVARRHDVDGERRVLAVPLLDDNGQEDGFG